MVIEWLVLASHFTARRTLTAVLQDFYEGPVFFHVFTACGTGLIQLCISGAHFHFWTVLPLAIIPGHHIDAVHNSCDVIVNPTPLTTAKRKGREQQQGGQQCDTCTQWIQSTGWYF